LPLATALRARLAARDPHGNHLQHCTPSSLSKTVAFLRAFQRVHCRGGPTGGRHSVFTNVSSNHENELHLADAGKVEKKSKKKKKEPTKKEREKKRREEEEAAAAAKAAAAVAAAAMQSSSSAPAPSGPSVPPPLPPPLPPNQSHPCLPADVLNSRDPAGPLFHALLAYFAHRTAAQAGSKAPFAFDTLPLLEVPPVPVQKAKGRPRTAPPPAPTEVSIRHPDKIPEVHDALHAVHRELLGRGVLTPLRVAFDAGVPGGERGELRALLERIGGVEVPLEELEKAPVGEWSGLVSHYVVYDEAIDAPDSSLANYLYSDRTYIKTLDVKGDRE
jgi:hypothetical protein